MKHPFIISMIGVCMRPKAMLLLEFAELGSLSSFDPYSNLSLPLKHRIAVQVLYNRVCVILLIVNGDGYI